MNIYERNLTMLFRRVSSKPPLQPGWDVENVGIIGGLLLSSIISLSIGLFRYWLFRFCMD